MPSLILTGVDSSSTKDADKDGIRKKQQQQQRQQQQQLIEEKQQQQQQQQHPLQERKKPINLKRKNNYNSN